MHGVLRYRGVDLALQVKLVMRTRTWGLFRLSMILFWECTDLIGLILILPYCAAVNYLRYLGTYSASIKLPSVAAPFSWLQQVIDITLWVLLALLVCWLA